MFPLGSPAIPNVQVGSYLGQHGTGPLSPTGEIVRSHNDPLHHIDDEASQVVETQDLVSKFMFFATFEQRAKQDAEKKRKVFRITPPREDQLQVDDDAVVLPKSARRCMAVNCAVCKLRVIFVFC